MKEDKFIVNIMINLYITE